MLSVCCSVILKAERTFVLSVRCSVTLKTERENPCVECCSLIFRTDRKFELLSYWQYMETDQDTLLELLFKAIDIEMIHVYCCDLEEWRELGNPAQEV